MDRLAILAVLVLGTIFTLSPSTDARMRALSLPTKLKDCYTRAQNFTTVNYVGGLYCWYCETPVRAQIKGAPSPLKPQQYAYYRELYNKVDPTSKTGFRGKRQAVRCLRKEYRMLTDDERNRFHTAVRTLKEDTTVEPNKYDALALFHTGVATFVAHGGPGFPGWHRLYLLLFEAALQEVDPTVCVPYWDSTMDSALENPDQSYIWSNTFFGGHEGELVQGPFANWRTPEGMNLRRSVGRDGQLFTRESIELIMSRNTYEEILLPDQDPQYSLEFHHGGAHVFVGGDMERLDTAAFDVVFFLHHAFVDYIWETFRDKMRNNGLNPEVYPTGGDISEFHLATAPMGFGNITHAEGYLSTLMDSYEYAPAPECSRLNPDCGSKYLWCNVTAAQCLPMDPLDPPIVEVGPDPHPAHCPFVKPQSYQNSFCLNGVCDVSQWVWVPVKVVAQRPPEFHDYHSYPVEKGRVSGGTDIYEPARYTDTRQYIKTNKPKPRSYEHCEVKDGVGKIFVSSQGVNYDGTYKESAIIDQRLATSISVTYVAVQDPAITGSSELILRAHDQCGRICHTACKIPGSNPPRYEGCSGVVQITPDFPRQYHRTYAGATLGVYDYASNSDCPTFKDDDFFVTFYCDYRDHLPWIEKPTTLSGAAPIITRPTPIVRPISNAAGQCRLSSQCTINKPCKDPTNSEPLACSKYMEMHGCMGNCRRYAICIYGIYMPRLCPSGMYFDELKGRCIRGRCPDAASSTSGGGFRPSWGQTNRPTSPGFGSSSYYGRLINRFGLGK